MENIEERIGETIRKMTPNDANTIVNELDLKKKKKWFQVFKPAYIAGLVFCLTIGVFGFNTINAGKIYSTVSLDVNPSIEINVNAKDKVISVNAYNEDAKTVVGDMDFKGASLEVTINALIGSLLRNGYLSDTANSILVSVDGKNVEKNKKLEAEIVNEIEEILSGNSLQAAVLSQVLDKDETIAKYAEDYGISKGKATLIYDIINSENSTHTFEELKDLTINELNLLVSSPKVELSTVKSNGATASDKGYIGRDAAKVAALAKAGVKEADIYDFEIELDYEHGVMVYEVEFNCGNTEYDIKVNALDGSIVHYYSELDDDYVKQESKQSSSTSSASVSKEDAKQIALKNAGVSNISDYEIELDDGKYEVSFKSNGVEYEYEIDPATGKILKQEKEIDDDYYETKHKDHDDHDDDDDDDDWHDKHDHDDDDDDWDDHDDDDDDDDDDDWDDHDDDDDDDDDDWDD